MNLSINGSNFLGYAESKEGTSTFKTFSCKNQRENEEIYHQVTEDELTRVLVKAETAAEDYFLTSIEKRKSFLQTIIDLLEENRSRLIQQFCKESSLGEKRASVELSRTQLQIKTYLDFISRENWSLNHSQEANGLRFENRYLPLGVVVVFGASNFPFAYSTIGGDTASALAAGNPVIYKSNPFHAGTSELVARIILEAAKRNELLDGVFSHIQGQEYWIGEHLVKHPAVKAVGFTGSVKGGTALLEYAKQRYEPIPIFCEMGSLNPTFIFEDAFDSMTDEMVEKLSHAIQNDAGQFCTKPGLIFTEGEKAIDFIEKMKIQFQTAAMMPMLHPSIYQSYLRLTAKFKEFEKATSLHQAEEYSVYPELIVMSYDEFMQSEAAKEEVFGPFSIIVWCENQSQMKAAMKSIGGHLTASYWSLNQLPDDWNFLLASRVGRIIRNGVSTGVAVVDAQHHGGNFPATSDSRFTAVGKDAIYRFMQPVVYQEE